MPPLGLRDIKHDWNPDNTRRGVALSDNVTPKGFGSLTISSTGLIVATCYYVQLRVAKDIDTLRCLN